MPIRATDAPPPVAPTRGPSEFKALAAALEELGARLEPVAAVAGSGGGGGGGAAAAAAGSDVCARTAALDAILATLLEFEPAAERQRARCAEVDPVSGNARFGPKMMAKVTAATERHAALLAATRAALEADADALRAALDADAAAAEQAASVQAAADDDARAAAAAAAAAAAETEAATAAAAAAAAGAAQQRDAALHQAAEAARAVKRREAAAAAEVVAAEEAARREAVEALAARVGAFGTGAAVAAAGLAQLREECAAGLMTFGAALGDLRTMVDNIAARPDEPLFRRLRCSNAKVEALTGAMANDGAVMVLAATGFGIKASFENGAGGEPVFAMDEPNLEQDMDAWSAWFDNISAVRKVLHDCTAD